jgi:hypothetical protein
LLTDEIHRQGISMTTIARDVLKADILQRLRLIDARMKLATLVVEDEAFLPFFKRIEDELSQLDRDHGVLERARALVASGTLQKATR